MSNSLDTEVRTLLGARKGDWRAISDATDVSYSWLSKFFNGHIDNPGFNKLKSLHEYLAKPRRPSKQKAEAA